MLNIEDKLVEMKNVGRVKKLTILNEILHVCYQNRDTKIYDYFDKFLESFEEYIDFDPNIDFEMKQEFTNSFEILFRFINNSNNIPLFKKYFQIYLAKDKWIVDEVAIANLYQCFGYMFSLQGNNKKAISFLKKSLELIESSGNNCVIPGRFTNLGFIYENIGDFEKAESLYLEGLEFAKNNNYENAIKLAYAALGRLFLARNDYDKAIQYFRESLYLFNDSIKNMDKVAIMLNLASAYSQQKKFKEAITYFLEIKIEWVKQTNSDLYQAIELNLSNAYIGIKNYISAESLLLEILKKNVNRPNNEVNVSCFINLGLIYTQTNQPKESINQFTKALEMVLKSRNERPLQVIYYNLGIIHKKIGEYDKAIGYYLLADELTKKQKNKFHLINILQDLSECYHSIGKFEKALNILKESNILQRKYDKEQQEIEKTLQENKLIDSGTKKNYLFTNNNSFISNELSSKIGVAIIGKSEIMKKIVEQAMLSSKNDSVSILLLGESGVGKELIAKLIHFSGNRSQYDFVDINSASFTTELAESTLFGHEKGAFTGANFKHIGYFQTADNGTVFLDEIGEMPLHIQAKILRVIENKSISPVGSSKNIKVNFRLICATNVNLEKYVEKGLFRFDLLNRINTIIIKVPALRERREDIPILIEYFIATISSKLNQKKPMITSKALDLLYNYNYPGNVRELANILERLILFCQNNKIEAKDVILGKQKTKKTLSNREYKTLNLIENEKTIIIEALEQAKHIKSKAALLLGISPYALRRKMVKFNITQS